jgi:acyl-CoA hydrolase
MKKSTITSDTILERFFMTTDQYSTTAIISRMMLPEDANAVGMVHGGVIMKEIDNAAGVAAIRYSKRICVTASIDRLDFHNPCFIGNLLTIKSCINMTGTTSMEVGTRAEAEDLCSGVVTHLASAYLTFVALDKEKKPVKVPPFKPITKEEHRRDKEALSRKNMRLSEKRTEHACQDDNTMC